jgi:RNA polymerase sigma factor (sigma-70 family)
MLTEEEIIKGCKNGSPDAQEALYKKYSSRMKMICLRYVKNTFEAEDLFHESLIKIFNKINTYTGKGSFSGWINSITVRTAIDHYHKENKIRNTSQEYGMEEVNHSEEDGDDQFHRIAAQLQVDDLLAMVNKLPDGYRMVFNLYAIENYSHKEISKLLHISEGTSKSQLSKARKHLKEWIVNHCLIENEGGI